MTLELRMNACVSAEQEFICCFVKLCIWLSVL